MHRPDTIIEIHRERVQDQTVEMFGGSRRINVAMAGQRRARRNRPL